MQQKTNIFARRRSVGLRQVELARRVGISQQHYCGIERGRVKPSIAVALRLARELESTVEELFGHELHQEVA